MPLKTSLPSSTGALRCRALFNMDPALTKSGAGKADHNDATSPESRFLGQKITDAPELDKLASPITYVHVGMPPFLIIHGGADFTDIQNKSISYITTFNFVADFSATTDFIVILSRISFYVFI